MRRGNGQSITSGCDSRRCGIEYRVNVQGSAHVAWGKSSLVLNRPRYSSYHA